jgi:tRNA(adenine34) deaminase
MNMKADVERARRMMRTALEKAKEAGENGEVPVGALVARGDEIIACAANARERSLDPTAHAEILALREAAARLHTRRLTGCTLYVTLEPCPMCAGAIVMARPDAVVFGAADPAAGCAGSVYAITEDPVFGTFIPAYGGVLEAECAQLLKHFFVRRREEGSGTNDV